MVKLPFVFRIFFFVIVPVWVLAWVCLRAINPQPHFAGTNHEIAYWEHRGNYYKATDAALREVNKNKSEFAAHAVFLRLYASLELRERTLITLHIQKTLGDLQAFYKNCLKSTNANTKNIGLYGSTLIDFYIEKSKRKNRLLARLDSLNNKKLPYVNELCFDVCKIDYSPDSCRMYLEREISINSRNQYAWTKLLYKLSYDSDTRPELEKYLDKAESLGVVIESEQKRWLAWNISPKRYVMSLYEPLFYTHSITEIIIAALIFLVWLAFIFTLNIFKDVKWFAPGLVLVLALLLHPFVMVAYDYVSYALISLEIFPPIHSLQSDILITGLIEETVKLLPVLLVLTIASRGIASPLTLLLMGGTSALVFAFEENILYFGHYYDVSISSRRAVLSVAMHLFTGSLTTYGIALVKYARKKWYWVPLCFIIAMCIHGLYNFLLTVGLGWVAVVLTVCCIFAWGSLVNNCLNNSTRFNENKNPELYNKSLWIIAGLSTIIVIEFVLTAYSYGLEAGEYTYSKSLLRNVWLILVIGISFKRMELEKGKWDFIDVAGIKSLSLFGPFTGRQMVCLNTATNKLFASGETFTLTVVKKVKSAGGENWYLVTTTSQKLPQALIRFKEEGANFYDFNVYVHVLLVEGAEPAPRFNVNKYPFIGFVKMSPVVN
ncbi:MAG TPA: PrsW family glutamic-type intramembrane protease [Flavobacteriales bacterium]|nr:PrsW family glutamic-type intramembrane protease [Flavobacteriales bacterium]